MTTGNNDKLSRAMMKMVSLENTEHYPWGEGCYGWHFLKDQNLSVIRECVPAGKSEVRHLHRTAQQFFFILNGQAVLDIEGEDVLLSAGQGVHVPAGTAHRFKNQSAEAVEFLVISNPVTRGDRENLP